MSTSMIGCACWRAHSTKRVAILKTVVDRRLSHRACRWWTPLVQYRIAAMCQPPAIACAQMWSLETSIAETFAIYVSLRPMSRQPSVRDSGATMTHDTIGDSIDSAFAMSESVELTHLSGRIDSGSCNQGHSNRHGQQ